jgi:hypothetical protein
LAKFLEKRTILRSSPLNHSQSMKTLTFLLLSFTAALADDAKKAAWSDVAKAKAEDPDFSIQGEYTGKLDDKDWGVQVVAEGGGKFAVVVYPGGLPGAGFSGDKTTRLKGKAARNDKGIVEVVVNDHAGVIKDGKIIGDAGEFTKVERKSPTLGTPAPTAAKVLFDGKSTDAFPGAKLDGDTLCQGITSKEKVGSGQLHVEFQIPYMPQARGQGRGNSGCYLQGRYEVQMLDSFGLEGENNECGGIYTIKTPDVNMAFPPLTWQSYDIDYTEAIYDTAGKKTTDAKVSVKHNGVVVHNNAALPHGTTSAPVKEGPEPGPLHFQDHGTPVRYRNIWWLPKP